LVRAKKPVAKATLHSVHAGSYLWNDVQNLLKKSEASRTDFPAWSQQIDTGLSTGAVIVLAAQVYQGRNPVTVGYSIIDTAGCEIESMWVAPDVKGMGVADQLYGLSAVNIGIATPAASLPPDMRDEAEGLRRRLGGTLTEDNHRFVLSV
jgi:hypothetical protein